MAPITIGFGLVLVALGIGFKVATDTASMTPLIPAYLGLALVVLGSLARRDNLRKHAMHAAAALGLVGFAGGAFMAFRGGLMTLLSGGEVERPNAVIESALLAVICAAFVGLCVKSFVDARRKRAQRPE